MNRVISSRTFKLIAAALVAVTASYVLTVGAFSAISRHMEDGRLQSMPASFLASTVMEIYQWPARRAAVLPPIRWILELSAAFWCAITDAPETTA